MDEMHDNGRTIDAAELNLCREALPLLGERSHQSNDESRVKRKVSTQNPPVGDGLRAVPQTGRGDPRPLTSPQRGGSMPPLCKGRWVGVSRAGGIVQQTEGQAPISGESAADPAADNPSAASRRLPLHKEAKLNRNPALSFPNWQPTHYVNKIM